MTAAATSREGIRVGLVVHSGKELAIEVAARTAAALQARGVEVIAAAEGDSPDELGVEVVDDDFAGGLDLAMSFGGDGTFLRAAHRCRDHGVPVLGVNLGRLGFLAEVERDQLDEVVDRVATRRWTVDGRATLEVSCATADATGLGTGWALNEVAIEKSARQHMLHMEVSVQGNLFTHVGADALIVSTTTGSTAYALSAGGPIVSPDLDATLVVPVAPHTLFDRTLITHPSEAVRVTIASDQEPAVVTCDGRTPIMVPAAGVVTVVGSDRPVKVARIDPLPFTSLIRRKFGLS